MRIITSKLHFEQFITEVNIECFLYLNENACDKLYEFNIWLLIFLV